MSIFQLQDGDPEKHRLYRTDRRAATAEAMRRIAWSLVKCKDNTPDTRLAMFASGSCLVGHVAAKQLDGAVRKARALLDFAAAREARAQGT